jgi:hypothetical protein
MQRDHQEMPQHYLELLLEVLLTSSPIKGDSMHLIYLYLALVRVTVSSAD